jgi:hypothetical protein
MWRRICAILLAHAIASWLAMLAIWVFMLTAPHITPAIGNNHLKILVLFSVTMLAAPLVLPVLMVGSIIKFRPDMTIFLAIPGAVYIVVAVPVLIVCWQLQNARIAQKRRQAGQCLICGYDLRSSPARCPECGAIPRAEAKT